MKWEDTKEAYHTAEEAAREDVRGRREEVLNAAVEHLTTFNIPADTAREFIAELERVLSGPFQAGPYDWGQTEVQRTRIAFEQYLGAYAFAHLPDRLVTFVEHVQQLARRLGLTDANAATLIAQIILVGLFHVVRFGAVEAFARHGDLDTLLGSFESIPDVQKALREEHERVLLSRSVQAFLPPPVTLIGYDPRFVGVVEGTQFYEKIFDDATKVVEGGAGTVATRRTSDREAAETRDVYSRQEEEARDAQMRAGIPILRDTYRESKADIYRDFHEARQRYDLLLVDYAWLPELAHQGHIIPLERFESRRDLESLIRDLVTLPLELRTWHDVLVQLAAGGNQRVYCLPAWLNFHFVVSGKAASEYSDLQTALQTGATSCVLQGKPSACSAYELYAHFAYEGATPLRVQQDSGGGAGTLSVAFATETAIAAFGAYLGRRYVFQNVDPMTRDPRKFDHEAELDLLHRSPEAWDIAFNSEFWRRSPPKVSAERPLRNPHTDTYLCSLGGFGIAVSRQARDPHRAYRYAREIFRLLHDPTKRTPMPHDEKLGMFAGNASLLPALKPLQVGDFMTIHVRPRVPFWTQLEEAISGAVEEIEDAFNAYARQARPIGKIGSYDEARAAYVTFLNGEGKEILLRLDRRASLTAENAGWIATHPS